MYRKVYTGLAGKALKQKKLTLLARIISQSLLIKVSSNLFKPLCGPLFGIIIVTYRCNLNCIYCDMPETARKCLSNDQAEMDTKDICLAIDEMADLGVKALAITGGEPLLRHDILQIIEHAHTRKILTHLSTNGVLIDDDIAKQLVSSGLDSISISLDASISSIHDSIRNVQGSFIKTATAISILVTNRNTLNSPVRIKILTVINKSNIDNILNLVEYARVSGVDGIELMPCQQLFSDGNSNCVKYDADFVDKIDILIANIMNDNNIRRFVENSTPHLQLIKSSFSGDKSPLACKAGLGSVVVDCYGDVYPCHPWANWRKVVQNIRNLSLKNIWYSDDYAKIRTLTNRCGDCYLNCQAELTILLGMIKSK